VDTQGNEGTSFVAAGSPFEPVPAPDGAGIATVAPPAVSDGVPTTGVDPIYGSYAPAIPASSPNAAMTLPPGAPAAAPEAPAATYAAPEAPAATYAAPPPPPAAPDLTAFPPPSAPAAPPAAPTAFPPPATTYEPPVTYQPPTTYEPPAAYEPPAEEFSEQSVERDVATTRSALEEDSKFEASLLADLLIAVQDSGASDLHLASGARPMLRIHGSLSPMDDQPLLTPPVIQRMVYAILTQKQREHFEEELELDFAYALPGRARFRVNIYRQRDAVGAAFRIIPYEIKSLEDLGVPPAVANFAMLPRGFVLVTGPTGSGKSTTLAAIVDLANRSRKDHIMTVEDPIEFLHSHKSCLVNQREVGEDTGRSRTRSSTCCGRTPTSSWSVRCVTSRPSPSR
jgi:twitching motility protein PilT